MSDRTKERDVAGTYFRIGDPYIWAEIYYLDSPTDYREYLPQNRAVADATCGDLVMLDSPKSVSRTFRLLLFVLGIILLTVGYFLHVIIIDIL
jgi:hypothetical protein